MDDVYLVSCADGGAPSIGVRRADRFLLRLKGLLGRPPGAEIGAPGLWLEPCRAIHTWGMRFAIDCLFVARDSTILRVVRALPPRHAAICRSARSVIELPAGMSEPFGLVAGARIVTRRQHGGSIVELLAVLPLLLLIGLSALQILLLFQAKLALNYAAFEAARQGAVQHAEVRVMKREIATRLAGFYGGGKTAARLLASEARAHVDLWALRAGAITILSPSAAAFEDFGIRRDGRRVIPGEHLARKSRAPGARSGVSLQDASLLGIDVTWRHKMIVPLANRMIARAMMVLDPGNAVAYAMDPPRIPLRATAWVRMQSDAWAMAAVQFRDVETLRGDPFRAQPHGFSPSGQCAHGAVRLSRGAGLRWAFSAAHRGYRRRARA